jgi:hypothetical protein
LSSPHLIYSSPVFNWIVSPAVVLLAGGSATAVISGDISRQFPESLIYNQGKIPRKSYQSR